MNKDNRAKEHLDFEDTTKEKLPKRRKREYVLYRNGKNYNYSIISLKKV